MGFLWVYTTPDLSLLEEVDDVVVTSRPLAGAHPFSTVSPLSDKAGTW